MTQIIGLEIHALQAFAVWSVLLVPGAAYVIAQACVQGQWRELPLGLALGAAAVALLQGMADLGVYFQGELAVLPPMGRFVGDIPAAGMVLLLAALTAGEALEAMRLYRRRGERLPPGVIKESLDTLPDGVCFYAPDGQPLLVNEQMNRISGELFGREILNADRFWRDVQQVSGAQQGASAVVRTQDGRVWEVRRSELTVRGAEVFELSALDVTEQHRLHEELTQRNERMNRVNERLRRFSSEIVTFTAEKELLAAKIMVHDSVGRALLAFRSYLAQEEDKRSRGSLLFLWRYVCQVMRKEVAPAGEWDGLERAAQTLRMAIHLDGALPENLSVRTAMLAAVRECLTNTASHAGGDALYVKVRQEAGCAWAELTNSGKPPKGEINETGGLKDLRRIVENAGGTMEVRSAPRFLLRVAFPERGEEDWLEQGY